MNWLLFLPAAAVGALAFRIRGGLITDRAPGFSGQLQRLIYAGLMALVTFVSGAPWVGDWPTEIAFAAALVAAWFAGAVAFGTFGAIDAGRNEGSAARDFALNAARGALYALLPALVVGAYRYLFDSPLWPAALLPALGLAQGAAYEAAWRFARRRQTVYAEFATGAFLGAGAFLAASLG